MTFRAAIAFAVALVPIAGCGSSPEPTFYALAPTTGAVVAAPPRTIELRRPSVAGYLDRDALVEHDSAYRLRLSSRARWGEPLGDMIGRVLAEDLADRLRGSIVFGEDAAPASEPDAIVTVDVRRFDEGEDGAVVLRALVTIDQGGRTTARTFALHARPDGPSGTALVGTMSALLGELADGIASMARASSANGP